MALILNPETLQQAFAKPIQAGLLRAPSGRIIASDPLVFFDEKPFATKIRPGEYSVVLTVIPEGDYERVALATLKLSEAETVSWVPAKREFSQSRRGGGEYEAYGVDSGTGCFMDATFQEVFNQEVFDQMDAGNYEFPNNLDWQGSQTSQRLVFEKPDCEANLVMFTSGYGDGGYVTYLGFDGSGNPSEFVTDFEVLKNLYQ